MIRIFDLVPGASRQNEAPTCQTKTNVQQIAVSRAGTLNDQYLVFIDANRDIYCLSLTNDSHFEIFKIGVIHSFIHLMFPSIRRIMIIFSIFRNTSIISNVGKRIKHFSWTT